MDIKLLYKYVGIHLQLSNYALFAATKAFHILAFVTAFGLSRALVLDAEYNGLKAPLDFSASVSRVDRMDK